MLVSQSLVVDAPAMMTSLLRVLDGSPFPRALWLENLDSSNTLTVKLESSNDGGITWVLIGTQFTILPGAVEFRALTAAGPLIRLSGSGSGELYVALARYQIPGVDAILTLLNL